MDVSVHSKLPYFMLKLPAVNCVDNEQIKDEIYGFVFCLFCSCSHLTLPKILPIVLLVDSSIVNVGWSLIIFGASGLFYCFSILKENPVSK